MLTDLTIKDFAIIDRLSLHFNPGLIAFTGETGAGKSIILDALQTVMGERADISFIRAGTDLAIVEAVFRIPNEPANVRLILEREELLDDEQFLTLSRELRSNGRSVARVNGRSVPVGLLRDLSEGLIDLHGQSEHLSLLRTNEHLPLLDRYADTSAALALYQKTYAQVQSIRKEIDLLQRAQQEAERRTELLRYQVDEIISAHLKADEEETLRAERDRLANAESLAALAQEALQALDESSQENPSAADLIGQASHALGKLQRFDSSQSSLNELADVLLETISDLTQQLRDYIETIEFNPKRLDQVEERLDLIHNLKRKYGDSISAILAHSEKAQLELDNITHAQERQNELSTQLDAILQQLTQEGQDLSQARHIAANQMAEAVQIELNDLKMQGAQFKVDFQYQEAVQGALLSDGRKIAYTENGFEQVEFLIAPNPGEGFKPLVKIASGGETSRLMLALKNVLARADHIPTLVFDEIDQGIGGRVGTVVGQKLWQLGRNHQVFCVTHLPQLAAYGDQHFRVQKITEAERTTTQVTALGGQERVLELAQMLGDVSEGTLRSAFELLQSAELNHPS